MIVTALDHTTLNRPPYLYYQFVGTEVETMCGLFDEQYNELEAVIEDLYTTLWINGASGTQLDVLGILVGLRRQGQRDTVYARYIALKAILNRIAGTPESLIIGMRVLYNADFTQYIPVYPAAVYLIHSGSSYVDGAYFAELIEPRNSGLIMLNEHADNLIYEERDEINQKQFAKLLPAGVGWEMEKVFLADAHMAVKVGMYLRPVPIKLEIDL